MKTAIQRYTIPYVLVFVGCLAGYAADECFSLTHFDTCWTRRCRRGQFVSSLDSTFRLNHGDRVWRICCRNLPPGTTFSSISCDRWTGFQNFITTKLDFVCPNNGYMAGLNSCHYDAIADRRFRFKCCRVQGSAMLDCENWGVNNLYQGQSTYRVEEGRILTGMSASYSARFKDRVFENTDCVLTRR